MKKNILCMMLVLAALCGCTPKDSTTLRVKMDVAGFGDTVLVYGGAEKMQFVGKDDKIEFEVQVDTPYNAVLYQPKLERGDMENAFMYRVTFVGGDEVCITQTEPSRYDVDGTGFYADYHKVDLMIEEAQGKNMEDEELFKMMADYAKANPKQEAIVPFLFRVLNADKAQEVYGMLDASVREGRMKVLYDEIMQSIEESKKAAERESEAAKKQQPGLEAPDFMLTNINGKPFSLSSLRGKYVILDFWGSWCGWCIKGFPKMKEYYAKYKGKFEILGIDCRDTEEDWKAAVKKHEVPWLHVYCPEDASVEEDYGITGYPTKIIVDPDGKIVKTIVGEDPAFYTLLDELFQ